MSVYKIEIELDPGQQKAMDEFAKKSDKTVDDILNDQVTEKVIGQVNQWIQDAVNEEMRGKSPAEILTRLRYLK